MGYMKLAKIFGRLCGNRCKIILLACLPIFLFTIADIRGEETSTAHFIARDQEGALTITSKKMTLKNQENTILFEGDVVVERDTMRLKANKVDVVFIPMSEREQGLVETVDKKREVSTITATGNVEFVQDARTIHSNKVTYYKKDEKMVFTGSPDIREGQDELKGERITVYINEDRVVVEGGEAIIHPR